ncbi:MAG TPA: hypothetical protein VK034_17210 [Enhygromyxa sp.]|nr:hypothetical protein [Enhygromyxa sp.]
MQQFFGGLALGALLGVGGFYAYWTTRPPAPDCAGLCGDGTTCEQGRCVLVEPEPELVEEPEDDGKSKRKGKRRRGKAGADGGEPELAGSGPPIDDDSQVPRFDPNKDQTIGMSDGSGRLSDATIDRELAKLDKQLQACVRDANDRVAELGTGTVKYSFGVAGSGKVTGVNVSAPQNLKDAGIVPCVRKVVYGHKFPVFDGPEMKASSSFSVH